MIRRLVPDDAAELARLLTSNRGFLTPFQPEHAEEFFSPEGQRMVTGGRHEVHIYRTDTWERERTIPAEERKSAASTRWADSPRVQKGANGGEEVSSNDRAVGVE